MNTSTEGHQWTRESGLEPGLPTLAAIHPASNIQANSSEPSEIFDVVIVGAGYTGLTAARDLTTSGHSVLLLEARDRIGGRTWSSNFGGYPFELGGTWVHWNQPHVYREISRYSLRDELENSHDLEKGVNEFVLKSGGKSQRFSRAEEGIIMDRVLRKLLNVDGAFGRKVVAMPGITSLGKLPSLAQLDGMSIRDRIDQLQGQFDATETAVLEGFLSITCGSKLEDASFTELLRWWALNNYDMQLFMEQCLTYKLRSGQSYFARKFFDEALSTGRLTYAFKTPITSVTDDGTLVAVSTANGGQFKARHVACTVPLNVLKDITFNPPLDPLKVEASTLGHVNQVSKVHVECANPELRSLSGTIANPHDKLTYIFGDGTTPAGNTHLVSFGSSYNGVHLHPEDDIEDTKRAFQAFADMDVRRIVFHNWSKDPYAKGAWEWLRPDMLSKKPYLDALRQRQGNMHFASADWAYLWRGFIDGAIEDGARVAMEIKMDVERSKQRCEENQLCVFGHRE